MATDTGSGRATQKKRREDSPLVFSVAQVARVLQISEWHVGQLARRGEIPSIKLGGRRVFPRAQILALINPPNLKETATK